MQYVFTCRIILFGNFFSWILWLRFEKKIVEIAAILFIFKNTYNTE